METKWNNKDNTDNTAQNRMQNALERDGVHS